MNAQYIEIQYFMCFDSDCSYSDTQWNKPAIKKAALLCSIYNCLLSSIATIKTVNNSKHYRLFLFWIVISKSLMSLPESQLWLDKLHSNTCCSSTTKKRVTTSIRKLRYKREWTGWGSTLGKRQKSRCLFQKCFYNNDGRRCNIL